MIRDYCLSKRAATEDFPFDDTTLVFKVLGKMFALTDLEDEPCINVKCDPEKAIVLREIFPAVNPGYHMNKSHWNTVKLDGSVSDKLIYQWIDDSYELVLRSLSKTKRIELLK